MSFTETYQEENNEQEPQICHMKFWLQHHPLKAARWLSQINLPDTASPAWLVWFTVSGSQTPAVLQGLQPCEETKMSQQTFLTVCPFNLLPKSITPLVLCCSILQIYFISRDELELFQTIFSASKFPVKNFSTGYSQFLHMFLKFHYN